MNVLQWFSRKKEAEQPPSQPEPPHQQPAAPKARRLPVRIQPDSQGEFTETELGALMSFINSPIGQKLLANFEHTIYLEALSPKPMSEWQRGRIAGLAYAVDEMRNVSPKDKEEDEEDEELEYESAYPE